MTAPQVIYLDNNATTRLAPEVLDAMLPWMRESWGNPGSPHALGRAAGKAVSSARRTLAQCLGVHVAELVFTASGTESNNLALRGVVARAPRPRHVVTTAVEHAAVLQTCEALVAAGECQLTVVPVDEAGLPDMDAFAAALRPGQTCLVSVMAANNETGVLMPIAKMGERARAVGALFHVDAIQVPGRADLDLGKLPVDLATLSAHKFHGPKGIGLLYVRRGTQLSPQLTGGGQERGRRSGTENPAATVGMARAMELVTATLDEDVARMTRLRDRLQAGLKERVPAMQVSGADVARLPNTLHVTFPDVEAGALLLLLDREGIACSAGSACSTGALEPSHVLKAIGVPKERLHGALRLCVSRETTEAEIDAVVVALPRAVERLRAVTD